MHAHTCKLCHVCSCVMTKLHRNGPNSKRDLGRTGACRQTGGAALSPPKRPLSVSLPSTAGLCPFYPDFVSLRKVATPTTNTLTYSNTAVDLLSHSPSVRYIASRVNTTTTPSKWILHLHPNDDGAACTVSSAKGSYTCSRDVS